MKKLSCLLLIFTFSVAIVKSQQQVSQNDKMEWWREARFGMFIHFGVYAQLAGEYNGHQQARGGAEWIMNRMKVPVAEYKAIAEKFNPVKFDADL